MDDCIFCKMVSGDMSCHKIFEDDHVIAFLDIFPQATGHALIVPKEHANDLRGSSADELCAVMSAVQRLAPAILAVSGADAFQVVSNVGKEAGQTVFHTHVHIIPRTSPQGAIRKDFDALVTEITAAL